MKKLLTVLMLALTLGFAGCTSRTMYGECVGVNNDDRDPKLHYRVDTGNVIVGIIFVETIIVPAVVLLDELYCPDRVKGVQSIDKE